MDRLYDGIPILGFAGVFLVSNRLVEPGAMTAAATRRTEKEKEIEKKLKKEKEADRNLRWKGINSIQS